MEAHGDCEFLFEIGKHWGDLQALLHIRGAIGSLENIVLLISYIHTGDLRQ